MSGTNIKELLRREISLIAYFNFRVSDWQPKKMLNKNILKSANEIRVLSYNDEAAAAKLIVKDFIGMQFFILATINFLSWGTIKLI